MRRSLSSSACRRALASASSAARRLFRHSRDASWWHSPHQELRPSLQAGIGAELRASLLVPALPAALRHSGFFSLSLAENWLGVRATILKKTSYSECAAAKAGPQPPSRRGFQPSRLLLEPTYPEAAGRLPYLRVRPRRLSLFFISHGELPLDLRMAQSAKGHQIAQRVRTAL